MKFLNQLFTIKYITVIALFIAFLSILSVVLNSFYLYKIHKFNEQIFKGE